MHWFTDSPNLLQSILSHIITTTDGKLCYLRSGRGESSNWVNWVNHLIGWIGWTGILEWVSGAAWLQRKCHIINSTLVFASMNDPEWASYVSDFIKLLVPVDVLTLSVAMQSLQSIRATELSDFSNLRELWHAGRYAYIVSCDAQL